MHRDLVRRAVKARGAILSDVHFFRKHSGAKSWVLSLLCLAAFLPAFLTSYSHQFATNEFDMSSETCPVMPRAPGPYHAAGFIEDFESNEVSVHSASMARLANGQLLAAWFEGSREGAPDVAIHAAAWDPAAQKWLPPNLLVTRERAQDEIGRSIRKIGNPVLFTDHRNRTWLFFVTVTFGGWSGSDINFKYSDDSGRSWSAAKRLKTAPIPHSGTLVRGNPFEFADGSIALPVYREYGRLSFPELVRIDSDGQVIGKIRMGDVDAHGLQPSIVTIDGRNAVGFLRPRDVEPMRVMRTTTSDGGATWTLPTSTGLSNPDAAVAAMRLGDGALLMVYNDSILDRNSLRMSVSNDLGETWRQVYSFEDDSLSDAGYSYPNLYRNCDGEVHLLYTWRRKKIKHIVFNSSWIDSTR